MTARLGRWRAFLSAGGFPERGTGRTWCGRSRHANFPLVRGALAITFTTVLPFIATRRGGHATTPEELPSFHERSQAPSSFHRFRRSFRRGLIDWRYRWQRGCRSGRSRTFTGQCCRPFCPGDSTSHPDGPRAVTKSRRVEGRISPSGLHLAWEFGPPSEPKRDASRTIFTWPLRRRSLPPDAGCVPRQGRVRVKISERAWTRSGRIRFHRTSFLIKSHRLILSQQHLRLTPSTTRKRVGTSALAQQQLTRLRVVPVSAIPVHGYSVLFGVR